MNFDRWRDAKWLPYTIAACSGVLFYFILQHISILGSLASGIWKIVSPLVLSVVIAYMLDPLVLFFEDKICSRFIKPWHPSTKRKCAIGLTMLSLLFVLILLLLALIPQLVNSILYLFENFSENIYSLESQLNHFTGMLGATGIDLKQFNESIMKVLESISGIISNGDILNRSQALGSGMSTFIVGLVIAIYLLMEKKHLVHTLQSFMKRLLTEDVYVEVAAFCSRCHTILIRYLACTIIEGIVVGCVNAIFMLCLHMPYAVVVSVIVGVTNLAPTFGPIVGCILGMFILLLSKPIFALYFLLFTLVLQTIDGYIIKPRLFGNSLGVSPLLILISIVIGGQLFGVLGIILAIPFSAILQSAVTEYIFPYTREMGSDAVSQREEAASHMYEQMQRRPAKKKVSTESPETRVNKKRSNARHGKKSGLTMPSISKFADDVFESIQSRSKSEQEEDQ